MAIWLRRLRPRQSRTPDLRDGTLQPALSVLNPAEPEWIRVPPSPSRDRGFVRVAVPWASRLTPHGRRAPARQDIPSTRRSTRPRRPRPGDAQRILLSRLAAPLRQRPHRLNVSLDTLKDEKFVHIARARLQEVWAGLTQPKRPVRPRKINMVGSRRERRRGRRLRVSPPSVLELRSSNHAARRGRDLAREQVVPGRRDPRDGSTQMAD